MVSAIRIHSKSKHQLRIFDIYHTTGAAEGTAVYEFYRDADRNGIVVTIFYCVYIAVNVTAAFITDSALKQRLFVRGNDDPTTWYTYYQIA